MNKCARCGKTVYPTEELKCLDKLWHKVCFKCDECGMALSMKNYKGFNKIPYCSVHCPQVKATTVTETPESRRLAENTRLQSQVKYHEDFEKSKGKLTQVADDPETMRVMNTHKIISNVSYHGDLQKKKEMEERRLFLPNDTSGQTQVNGNHAVSGHQSQSNRHQVFAQQPQQQMAYNVHHQMNRVQHQQHSPQQFSSSIKILSQGNKAVDVKQQQQQQHHQQQLQQQKIQQKQQTSNGMKQPTVSQSGQQLNQQTAKNSNGISGRNPSQQFPQGNDFNQNQSHVQQNCPRSVVNTVTPVTTINQQPNRVSHSNQVLSQTQYQGVNLGGYSVIYDGSGQRVVDNSRKVQEYDAMNQKYGPGVGFPGMKAPHQQLHYQSQQQSLPNYGQGAAAAAAQQQYHQQIMQQQQYLMQQQTQSMPLNQQQSLVHGSPMRSTSSGLMPVSGIQSLPPSSSLTVRAIYDYSAADVDEVSFLDGDVIVDCIPIDEGWMTGTVHRTGQRGMLPANYVESCQ